MRTSSFEIQMIPNTRTRKVAMTRTIPISSTSSLVRAVRSLDEHENNMALSPVQSLNPFLTCNHDSNFYLSLQCSPHPQSIGCWRVIFSCLGFSLWRIFSRPSSPASHPSASRDPLINWCFSKETKMSKNGEKWCVAISGQSFYNC